MALKRASRALPQSLCSLEPITWIWNGLRHLEDRNNSGAQQEQQDRVEKLAKCQQLGSAHTWHGRAAHAWRQSPLLAAHHLQWHQSKVQHSQQHCQQHQQFRGMAWWGGAHKPAGPATPAELTFVDSSDTPPSPTSPSVPDTGPDFSAPTDPDPALTLLTVSADSTEAQDAIAEACGLVEMTAVDAAMVDSVMLGGYFIAGVKAVHDLGLPWWAAIASINVATRLVTLPVIIANQRSTSRMMALNFELMPVKKLQEAMQRAMTKEQQLHIHNTWLRRSEEIKLKYGPAMSSIFLTMLVTLSINSVVFISIFNGVNNLMMSKAPSLTSGGMLWFSDLTLPDPYYGLPVICAVMTLAMIEYGMNVTGDQMATPERAEQAARAKNLFRLMALLFVPLGHYVPSGVAVLWASNSAFSVLVGVVLRQEGVRRVLQLPTLRESTELGEKLQKLNAADPMSFVPPMEPEPAAAGAPPPPPPPPAPASPAWTPPPPGQPPSS